MHHVVTHGFVGRPAGVTELLARWTEKLTGVLQAGRSDSPPLTSVKRVGRQRQLYHKDIKTNMRHIHTSIVSRHLATRGNNKILRTPPPHTSSSEEILPRLTRRTASLHTPKHITNCFTKQFTNTQHTKHTDPLTEQHKTYKDTTSHSLLLWSKRL